VDEDIRQPTMKDVANKVGVSQPTVSHVINGTAPISENVKKKVMIAIEELGYVPNAMAKGLKTRKSAIVGLIVPDVSLHYYSTVVKAIERALRVQGYMVFLCNTFYNPELERQYIETPIQHNVIGVLSCSDLLEKKSQKLLEKHRIPLVLVDSGSTEENSIMKIGVDNLEIVRMAIDHLYEMGARNICYVSEPMGADVIGLRVEAFRQVMKEKGLACGDRYCFVAPKQYDTYDKMQQGYNIAANILVNPEIDAVFASSDEFAFGVLNRLKEYGVKIPRDILLMGIDNDELSSMITPSLTSIVQPIKQMAKLGAKMLCEAIREEDIETYNIVLEPSILIRESAVKIGRK